MLGLDTIRSAGAGISRYDDCFERFGHKSLPTRRFPGSAGGRALVKQHNQLVNMMRGLLAELGIDIPEGLERPTAHFSELQISPILPTGG
jgi:hypothetical protein